MGGSLLQFLILCPTLLLLQVVAALPWVSLINSDNNEGWLKSPKTWGRILIGVLVIGVPAAFLFNNASDPSVLSAWGRIYASVLQLQLTADVIIFIFLLLLTVWPSGGAVALAAFREGVRQPMFWLLLSFGFLLLFISPFLPYFTFGEDLKMLKDLSYLTIMFVGSLFGVLNASISISEEIEGRTAVTVMSKPISRRSFLLGKFVGILLVCLLTTLLLGWFLVWVILGKEFYDPGSSEQTAPEPSWVLNLVQQYFGYGVSADFMRGGFLWVNDFGNTAPFLLMTFCQIMILLSVAVALATRVPMVVNVMLCLAIYYISNLTPVLAAISQNQFPLIKFVAQLFNYILPALDLFAVGPAVIRYAPLPPGEFAFYLRDLSFLAIGYTAIFLLVGLILFEDRDVA